MAVVSLIIEPLGPLGIVSSFFTLKNYTVAGEDKKPQLISLILTIVIGIAATVIGHSFFYYDEFYPLFLGNLFKIFAIVSLFYGLRSILSEKLN